MVTLVSLEAQGVTYAYQPEHPVIRDISVKLHKGEMLFILGRNGGGKTTLLHCLAGLLKPNSGKVLLEEKPINDFSPAKLAQTIGLIPQMHSPAFAYSVEEMVMMGRAPHLGWLDSPSQADQALVEEALEQVGLLELRHRPYTEISGGERQLVLIARGLAQKCHILLMDEPTAHLDLSNQHRVLEIINQLSRQGLSFIISSHAPNDALAYADTVLLLNGGWAIDYGPPKETLTESTLSLVYGIKTEVLFESEEGIAVPRAVVPQRPLTIKPESLLVTDSPLSKIFTLSQFEPQLILVTGLSGTGKTTWCSRLIDIAQETGKSVSGLLSPGLFKGENKTGISIKDLSTGESRQLASLRGSNKADLATPRWRFMPDTLSWANSQLENSPSSDLLIIDELGPLEFLRGEGLTSGLKKIDEKDYKVACVVVRSSLLPKALQRWPSAMVISGSGDRD